MTDRISIRLAAGSGKTFGVDDLACAAATTLGCWRDVGLDVVWTPVHGGVAAARAVIDGEVDVGYGGLGPAIAARAGGAPLRIVVSMARGLAQNLVAQDRIGTPDQIRGASWAIDGVGALSHHMARLTVGALGIAENDIDWRVVGPPPERIELLLADKIDVSLIRVEEALSLARSHAGSLRVLLGFSELKKLVPIQPHGVLTTLESYEHENPEALRRLACGMITASRALRDDYQTFRKVYDHHVTIPLPDEVIETIWRQEVETGGFAVNGGLGIEHWQQQMALYRGLNPDLPAIGRNELIAGRVVCEALKSLGAVTLDIDPPPDGV
jgi:ABC-type nitrate/sulfonate/bicarbonate transport system substrate-binding protein